MRKMKWIAMALVVMALMATGCKSKDEDAPSRSITAPPGVPSLEIEAGVGPASAVEGTKAPSY